jgi:D-alanine-D-alanine ligase-like ATP-grasp enzyme
MGTATHFLSLTAQKMGIPITFVDPDESILVLHFPKGDHFVVNTKLGLISDADGVLGLDKSYQYQILQKLQLFPKTKSYLDVNSKYREYAKFSSSDEIQKDIQANFSFPLVVKKNRGTESINVFLVTSEIELKEKIATVFNVHHRDYDYVLIAQEYIKPKQEYRVIIYNQHVIFSYTKGGTLELKNMSEEKVKKVEVTDSEKQQQINEFVQKIFSVWPLKYGGLDVIEDVSGKLWLIEINTAPSMAMYIEDNGEAKVLALYEQILTDLQKKYS